MERESFLRLAWRMNRFFPPLIAGLILLNAAAYLLLGYVVTPQRDALEKELMDLQVRTRQSRLAEAATKTPAAIYRRGEADLLKFRETIPAKNEFPALLGEVFFLADQAGLAIDQVSYQPKEVEGQGLLRYGLAFSVRGNYGQVKRFIHSLEQSERLMIIDGLTLSGGRESGEAKVELRLQLATFFLMAAL
jgi:type IV pilus assembly protein PilO